MLSYSKNQKAWSESKKKSICNLYAVTAIGWRQDGARLTIVNDCPLINTTHSLSDFFFFLIREI